MFCLFGAGAGMCATVWRYPWQLLYICLLLSVYLFVYRCLLILVCLSFLHLSLQQLHTTLSTRLWTRLSRCKSSSDVTVSPRRSASWERTTAKLCQRSVLLGHAVCNRVIVLQVRGLVSLVVASCTANWWVLGSIPDSSRDPQRLVLDNCFVRCHKCTSPHCCGG